MKMVSMLTSEMMVVYVYVPILCVSIDCVPLIPSSY